MKKIVLDTNFLMVPFEQKVDIFSEFKRICDFTFEVVVLEGTLAELRKLQAKNRGKEKKLATLALKLIEVKKIRIINGKSTYVDEDLLSLTNVVIATNDRGLKRALKAKGTPVITLRSKKYLIFV